MAIIVAYDISKPEALFLAPGPDTRFVVPFSAEQASPPIRVRVTSDLGIK